MYKTIKDKVKEITLNYKDKNDHGDARFEDINKENLQTYTQWPGIFWNSVNGIESMYN